MTDYITNMAREEISEEIDLVETHIMDGRPATFEEYWYKIGQVKAYRRANEILLEIERKFTQEDDD